MFRRRQMLHEIDVRRPWESVGILGASDQEAKVVPRLCGSHEQCFERWLAIFGVRPEVRQVSAIVRLWRDRPVNIGVDMTVKRLDVTCAESGTELVRDARSPGETQD